MVLVIPLLFIIFLQQHHKIDQRISLPDVVILFEQFCMSSLIDALFHVSYLSRALSFTCPVFHVPCLSRALSVTCPVFHFPYLLRALSFTIPVFHVPCLSCALSFICPVFQVPCLSCALSFNCLVFHVPCLSSCFVIASRSYIFPLSSNQYIQFMQTAEYN